MNEKMTDEDAALYQQIAAGDVAVNEDLLREWTVKAAAHIAALTSDLAESRTSSDDYRHGCEELTRERDTLRERVKALEADLDHSRKTSGKAIVEARDRVAAADRAVEVWRTECRAAESRLAAIRQRAREHATVGSIALNAMSLPDAEPADAGRAADSYILGEDAPAPVSEEESLRSTIRAAHTEIAALQAQLSGASEAIHSVRDAMLEEVDTLLSEVFRECERGTTTGTDFRKGVFYMLKTARERLAVLKSAPTPMDVRPVAPPEAFTHEKGLDAGVFDDAPLNPDATGEADQPLPEGPLEPADMTNEESGRICADAGVDVETGVAKCLEMIAAKRAEKPAPFRSEDEDPPLLLPQTPARHYPTTSEAFATVRREMEEEMASPTAHQSALASLSLLERHMVAMEAALRGCRTHLKCTEGCVCDVCTALVGASAAPPPEDVEERARGVYEAAIARREHQPAALALAVREALRLAPSGTVSASGPCGCGRPEAWTLEEVEQVLRREELGPATARRVREHLAALRRRP